MIQRVSQLGLESFNKIQNSFVPGFVKSWDVQVRPQEWESFIYLSLCDSALSVRGRILTLDRYVS